MAGRPPGAARALTVVVVADRTSAPPLRMASVGATPTEPPPTGPPPAEPDFGFPAPLWRAVAGRRPPLPRFRSPLRGPWLTSVLAVVLLAGLPIVIVTGLLSYVAYGPQFGQAIP